MAIKKTEASTKVHVMSLSEAKRAPAKMQRLLNENGERVQLKNARGHVVMDLVCYGGKSGRDFDV